MSWSDYASIHAVLVRWVGTLRQGAVSLPAVGPSARGQLICTLRDWTAGAKITTEHGIREASAERLKGSGDCLRQDHRHRTEDLLMQLHWRKAKRSSKLQLANLKLPIRRTAHKMGAKMTARRDTERPRH